MYAEIDVERVYLYLQRDLEDMRSLLYLLPGIWRNCLIKIPLFVIWRIS
ncbi:hypothetical protein [Methanothermobacter marburgensis]